MPKIRVVHCKKDKYDVYIGRPGPFGNPFIIGTDGDRDEVLQKFEAYLLGYPALLEKARRELKGKVLACWCAPDRCHGDIYKKYVDEV
jgi:hypothetical protein